MSTHPKIQYYCEIFHLGGGVTYTTRRYPTPEEAEAEAQAHFNKPGYIHTIKEDLRSREEIIRERFEKWASAQGYDLEMLTRYNQPPEGGTEPEYTINEIQLAWEAFQEGVKAVS